MEASKTEVRKMAAENALKAIAKLKIKTAERDATIAKLEAVLRVMAQGIDPAEIKSYGFDKQLLTQRQWRDRRISGALLFDHQGRPRLFNYAMTKSGEKVLFDPPLDAAPYLAAREEVKSNE